MSSLVDLRRDPALAPAYSQDRNLWGSEKLITLPVGATVSNKIDLVALSIEDKDGDTWAVSFKDAPENPPAQRRMCEVFFGSEGVQNASGPLQFPKNRILTFPGSYLHVVAWVEAATPHPFFPPGPIYGNGETYRLGAHAARSGGRVGNYTTTQVVQLAAGGATTINVPRWARQITVGPGTPSATIQPYQIEWITLDQGTASVIGYNNAAADESVTKQVSPNLASFILRNKGTALLFLSVDITFDF